MFRHELCEGSARIDDAGTVEFSAYYDIIVAGLGTAGAFCALEAANEGANVLGIERAGCMGGMCTLGAVNGYYYGAQGGLYEEIDQECDALKNVFLPFGRFHPDAKKTVLEKRLLEAGVDVRYNSSILGIYEENGVIRGVRVLCAGETLNLGCTVLVDGTSEGHVIRMYGIPNAVGRVTDGKTQPFTSVRVFLRPDGTMGRTNFDSGYVNQYDNAELTRAIINAHSHHTEALDNGERFLYAAPFIGVREGVNFDGEERLTLEDILDQKEYPDALCYGYSDIDKHGRDLAFDDRTYQDWFMVSNLSTVTVRIPIPLGCISPKGVTGLISTGRCLSMDSYAASSVRMNRDMHRLGQACGLAAVLSLGTGGKVMKIDSKQLRRKLEAQDCFDPAPDRRMGFCFPGNLDDYTPVEWMTGPAQIRDALSTDRPGVAIWSCRRLGQGRIGDALCEMMADSSEMLRYNAAIALGITDDPRALPVLRQIVAERCAFFYKDCRRTNQLRSANAICLLGRLGGREIVPELLEILTPEEFERPLYHELTEPSYQFGIDPGFNLVYFQHLSNAAAALTLIALRIPELAGTIRAALDKAFRDQSYIRRITQESEDTSLYKAAANIWEFVQSRLG